MKRLIVMFSVVASLIHSGLAASFSDQLRALQTTGTPEKVQEFIRDSYDSDKEDPEYFVASANYWWGLSQEVNISTKRPADGDFVVADQKTGKPVGSLSTSGRVNPQLASNATSLLQAGFKRFPDRLDIGVGLAFILRDQRQYKNCVDTLKAVLTAAASRPNDIRWKDGRSPPKPWRQFMPESLQDYTAALYHLKTKEGDHLCQELCEAIIKVYPDHPYAYNILAGLRSAHKDEKGCIKYLLIALAKAPDDTLMMFNLANAYKRIGGKLSAKHYYELIVSSNAGDDTKAEARAALASLQ